jgi:hypothetical protein
MPDGDGVPVAQGARIGGHEDHAAEGDHQPQQGSPGQLFSQQQPGEQGGEGDPELQADGVGAEILGQREAPIDQAKVKRPAAQDQHQQALRIGERRANEGRQQHRRHAEAKGPYQQRRQDVRRHFRGGVVDAPDKHDGGKGGDLARGQGLGVRHASP